MVQALEQTAREILTLLQGVHQGAGFQDSESASPGERGAAVWGGREGPPGVRRSLCHRRPFTCVSCVGFSEAAGGAVRGKVAAGRFQAR